MEAIAVDAGMQAYRDLGYGALFVFMYLSTLVYFLRKQDQDKKESAENIRVMAAALNRASDSQENNSEALEAIKTSMDQTQKSVGEFIAYIKGRDAA